MLSFCCLHFINYAPTDLLFFHTIASRVSLTKCLATNTSKVFGSVSFSILQSFHFHVVHLVYYVLTCIVCEFRQGSVVSNWTRPLCNYQKRRSQHLIMIVTTTAKISAGLLAPIDIKLNLLLLLLACVCPISCDVEIMLPLAPTTCAPATGWKRSGMLIYVLFVVIYCT